MYLHLGRTVTVATREIIGLFDLERTSQSKRTLEFLEKAQRAGKVISAGEDLPKSFVVTAERVYLSQLAPVTLVRRAAAPPLSP